MADHKNYSPLQKALKRPFACLLVTFRFLTILPTFSSSRDDPYYFDAIPYYFTVVGLIIGCIIAGIGFVLNLVAPLLVSAALLVVLLSFASGFFHLDGLADTADAFMSSRPRERCLEIMRDSRIGVMGAAALCSVLLVKTTALVSIAQGDWVAALIIAPAAGRTAMVISMSTLAYARSDDGLGSLFFNNTRSSAAIMSGVLLCLVCVLLVPGKLFHITIAFALVLFIFSRISLRKIGGGTGDTLGCLGELVEAAMLVTLSLDF